MANTAISTHRGSSSRPCRFSLITRSTASAALRPSLVMRIGTSIKNAATKKCPEPQQGSRSLNSARQSGQLSKFPAAGVPSSIARRYVSFTGHGVSGCRVIHQAPKELCNKNSTMYGSVKSCVTAGSSFGPIRTSEALMRSLLSACQN